MADNSKPEAKKTGPGRQFQPGQSGNPGGRPKTLREISEALEHLDEPGKKRIKEIIESGNDRDAVAALKLVWSYRYGMPRQVVTGEDGGPVRVDHGDLLEFLQSLAKAKGG